MFISPIGAIWYKCKNKKGAMAPEAGSTHGSIMKAAYAGVFSMLLL
jgi:hypothetical protein